MSQEKYLPFWKATYSRIKKMGTIFSLGQAIQKLLAFKQITNCSKMAPNCKIDRVSLACPNLAHLISTLPTSNCSQNVAGSIYSNCVNFHRKLP